jgi:hypothetical protein
MKLCVGAYAASPSANGWNPEIESQFYQGLRSLPAISGLEIPFLGTLHAQNPEWFLEQLSPDWNSVLTPIPGVMNTLAQAPNFGLASNDETGRKQALDFMQALLQSVQQMNRHFGRQVVSAVEVHSAPTLGKPDISSSIDAFAQSLSELRSWDWQGAQLVVEHCDAFVSSWPPAKGFLSLESEIEAIELSTGHTPAGILINWGRSAIEQHDERTPESHLRLAKQKGLLKGLIFSGATIESPLYGTWSDSHAPFVTPGSVLTEARAKACVEIADASSLRVFGFKMQALPKSLDVNARLNFIQNNLQMCQRLVAGQ